MINTLEIADELAEGGVFTRDQAERLARISAKAAGNALATNNDLNLLERRLETAIERAQKSLVMWFAGIMVVHATAVVALTVGLVKLL
jgi:predicted regulator of Ras-like GTPase activity (Roadblock/LC7/MglB family)